MSIAALLFILEQYLFLDQVEQSGLSVQSELQALLEITESHQAAQQRVSAIHRQFFEKQQQHIDARLEINIPMQIAYKIVQANIDCAYI